MTRDAASEVVLAVDGLNTTFKTHDGPVPAVRDVSFELRKGEFLGLVGESGCGKSTVLMSILHLLPENAEMQADSMVFDGREMQGLSEEEIRRLRGRRISLIPQRPMSSLSPVATIERQLKWFLQRDGKRNQSEMNEVMESMLERVGLRAAMERLSGVPPPVLGRPAPEDAHRHRGSGGGARGAAGGRADHHPRCDRPGAGTEPPAGCAGTGWGFPWSSSRTTWG